MIFSQQIFFYKARPLCHDAAMKTRSALFACVLLGAILAGGCTSPAGRAAKRDVAAVQQATAVNDAAVCRAQADNARIAADAGQLSQSNTAVRDDADRIDDKAVLLLKSKWKP